MTRDEAIDEAAQLFVDVCAELDGMPAEEVAQRAHIPGDPHSIADLVEIVREQRAEARKGAA